MTSGSQPSGPSPEPVEDLPPVDALLIVSFGGPEGPEEVMPFIERVLAGKPVPRSRMEAVAEHYHRFGGVSPINAEVRRLKASVEAELAANGIGLPVYWGNRYSEPCLSDEVATMAREGVRHALAFVTSAYSSYPACWQYIEAIDRAVASASSLPGQPAQEPSAQRRSAQEMSIRKIRPFYNHPLFIQANASRVAEALAGIQAAGARTMTALDGRPAGSDLHVVFSAHSIPVAAGGCDDYVHQLRQVAELVSERLSTTATPAEPYSLAFQSRSGRPGEPWLGPDIGDELERLAAAGTRRVVIAPIGFVSDHMEVVYDLDVVAVGQARAAGMVVARAGTAGSHPSFVSMVRELVTEITGEGPSSGRAPRACGPDGPAAAPCGTAVAGGTDQGADSMAASARSRPASSTS
ncbi:MAG: ferrochelatase [Acidimicrobiales bacterium]